MKLYLPGRRCSRQEDVNVPSLEDGYRAQLFAGAAQQSGLLKFVENGGGLVGVHPTDAFKKSGVYWRRMGGRFTTHRGGEFMIHMIAKEHPVTAPIPEFKIHDETCAGEYHSEFKLHSLFRMDRGEEQQSMG